MSVNDDFITVLQGGKCIVEQEQLTEQEKDLFLPALIVSVCVFLGLIMTMFVLIGGVR
jgi:hypothetical protein